MKNITEKKKQREICDMWLHLAGVHRSRGERCLAQSDGGSQQVSGGSLILTGLQFQLLPGQHGLIARSIAWRREELELAMPPPEEETHPAVQHVSESHHIGANLQYRNQTIIQLSCDLHSNTDLTPAEKLATGKKRPSELKFSNMP